MPLERVLHIQVAQLTCIARGCSFCDDAILKVVVKDFRFSVPIYKSREERQNQSSCIVVVDSENRIVWLISAKPFFGHEKIGPIRYH